MNAYAIAFITSMLAFVMILIIAIMIASELKAKAIEIAGLKQTIKTSEEKARAQRLNDQRWEQEEFCDTTVKRRRTCNKSNYKRY